MLLQIFQMYYLILSGIIPLHNQQEFEQTCKLVSAQMPETCKSHDFYQENFNQTEYSFISYWHSIDAMKEYKASPPYLIISGAFATLGELRENFFGIIGDSVHNES